MNACAYLGRTTALAVLIVTFSARFEAAERGPSLVITDSEQAVIDLTNVERQKEGLPALKPNRFLFKAARGHSASMSMNNVFDHKVNGKGPSDRIEDSGYDWIATRENIAFNQRTPEEVVDAWMHSPGHRENIMAKDITEIGVGIVKNAKGEPYWTQDFGRPKSDLVKIDFSIRNESPKAVNVDFAGKTSVIEPRMTMKYTISTAEPDPSITVRAGGAQTELKVENQADYKIQTGPEGIRATLRRAI